MRFYVPIHYKKLINLHQRTMVMIVLGLYRTPISTVIRVYLSSLYKGFSTGHCKYIIIFFSPFWIICLASIPGDNVRIRSVFTLTVFFNRVGDSTVPEDSEDIRERKMWGQCSILS